MKNVNLAGIDVSARELVVMLEINGKRAENVARFDNDVSGFKRLSRFLTKRCRKARVCMEATGVYHFECALFLQNEDKIEVMVVNPRAVKNFGKALLQRAKTDPIDAVLNLEYLKRMEFKEWVVPSDNCLKIQAIGRCIHQLKQERVREKNRLHAASYHHVMQSAINENVEQHINHIEAQIKELENKALDVIESEPKQRQRYDLLTSIKGISKRSAILILGELICLSEDMQAEQWVAYASLDPRPVESGSSLNKARHIRRGGNKFLRTALYMPAMVAIQHEPHVKAFYDKLKARGKKPLQIIVAVMRKLLRAIFGMFKDCSQWDGSKFCCEKI